MAADPKPDWLSCLPSSWSYRVSRDGRIFFINEEAKSTTWLHPITGEAVITGHRKTPDLPTGWEEGYTFEGARCFIKRETGGLTQYSRCHKADETKLFKIKVRPLYDMSRPPERLQRYLSPPFFSSLSRTPSSSPTIRASLSPQFTFAEEIKPMSFCVLTDAIRSSAYTDSLKDTSHWGKRTPFRLFLSLWSRGSMAREYYMPEREQPCLTPLWMLNGALRPPFIFRTIRNVTIENLDHAYKTWVEPKSNQSLP
ncbi:pleckstrin homology domain-containing family A member 7-like isoform X18 [Scophthalmus maximus]|uniref:pleckstrin homology domain-containing family A member 7-like isoform X18 n=1 Tax=Scophthalmus maximus TaxID=52904 RepID=UPI001FA81E01|nr:pleckstrin homology domain-containing family A member 7-like isoform X18 [Scophthalmus maximus]